MITVVRVDNVFQWNESEVKHLPYESGIRVSQIRPGEHTIEGSITWLNGSLLKDGDPVLQDEDFVTFGSSPTGPLAAAVPYILGAFVISQVAGAIFRALMPTPKQPVDNLGGSTYSYYGFRNAYRPEGDAVPVVYGTMRVAPPCINQSVTGPHNFSTNSAFPSVMIGRSERLNCMYAVSHGPIKGFGETTGDVYDDASWNAVTNNLGQTGVSDKIGFQINGIDGQHVSAVWMWRTGLQTQESISGLLGSSTLPITNAGRAYQLNLPITLGTESISGTDKPGGVYSYNNRIIEQESDQFVSQFLSAKADIVDVQILFSKGCFTGNDNGTTSSHEETIRVQYWKTDSGGSSTSDVIVLPPFNVVAALRSPFSVDIPFSLYGSSGYVAPVQQGYAKLNSDDDDTLFNTSNAGMALMRPGSSGFDPDLKFTFACWCNMRTISESKNFFLLSWANNKSAISAMGHRVADFWCLNTPDLMSNGDTFFSIRLCVGGPGWLPSGAGAGDVYVRIDAYDKGNVNSGDWAGSWWRSTDPIGTTSGNAAGWPTGSSTPNKHICVSYDGTGWDADGAGAGTFRLYVDGDEKPIQLGEMGFEQSMFTTTTFGQNGYLPGFMWLGAASDKPAYLHVPPMFKTAASDAGLHIGSLLDYNAGSVFGEQESRGNIAQVLMYDGLIGGSSETVRAWAYNAANNTDVYGYHAYDIRSLADDPQHASHLRICSPCDDGDVVATNFYKNFAYPDATTAAAGALQIEDATNSVVTTGGPVWTSEVSVAERDYYHVEVFRLRNSGAENVEGEPTVDSITSFSTGEFSYPGIAYAAVSVGASDQVNSNTPNITLICHGKKVRVWKGGSVEVPIFAEEWSSNPAWVALDMLSNATYGMGQIFAPFGTLGNFDLNRFGEWATFCDEGVPDAFGSLAVFGWASSLSGAAIGAYPQLDLYIGLEDTTGATLQAVPQSWRVGAFVSLTEVTAKGVTSEWVTADDHIEGHSNASSLMEIVSIETTEDLSGFHGWESYLTLKVRWNRVDSSGSPTWPESHSTTDSEFADTYGLTSLANTSGYEKRCSFDGVFDDKERPVWDALIDVFQAGRAMPVKVGRKILPVWDRPRDPVGLFTMANVVQGSLEIAYLSPATQPNSIETEILDRNHGYERRTVLVDHENIQNPTSFGQMRKERTSRLGITRASQATRDAYYRLNKYALQRRQFKFKVGPDALHLIPGDRVLLSHDVPQYGYSGRLTTDFSLFNIHPGSSSLVNAWQQNGGNCSVTNTSLIVADSTAPPISGYSNTALAYSVPTNADGGAYYPCGQLGRSGFNRTNVWAAQTVATADGLYPFPGNDNVAISPLDRIEYTAQKKEFSLYVKEPTTGASEGVRLNIYRYLDADGAEVKRTLAVSFKWDGSGDLVFDAYSGSVTSSPYGLSYNIAEIGSGWWRATVFYDNGDAQGGGAAAVGDYIQARIYYAYAPLSSTWKASPTGRGSNLFQFGDPSNLDGLLEGTTTAAWTKINNAHGGGDNLIAHITTVAPPFYTGDTGASAGNRGYVMQFTNDQASYTPSIKQTLTLPTDWPGASGAGNMTNEKVCCTFFVRADATNGAGANAQIKVQFSSAITTGTYGHLSGTRAHYTITPNGSGSISAATTGSSPSWTSHLAQVAKVKQTSTSDDSNWYQVDVAFSGDADYDTLFVEFIVQGTDGSGNAVVDLWGMRIHGEGATGTTGYYINKNTHRGTLLWGPLYNPDSDGSTVSAWNEGGNIQLDRDVTLNAGSSYEVLVRSSSSTDMVRGANVQNTLQVAQSQVPSSGSSTKSARSNIMVSTPSGMTPETGDVYSFGETDQTVEDMVVTDISLDAESMQREVTGIEYVEAIYTDTAFGTLSDVTISDLKSPGVGGDGPLYGFGSDGPDGDSFALQGKSSTFRDANGLTVPAIDITIKPPSRTMPYKEVRLYVSELTSDGAEGVPQLVQTLPFAVQNYRYSSQDLLSTATYRVRAQRVGWRGTAAPLRSASSFDVTPVAAAQLPAGPAVEIGTDGFKQVYKVSSGQDQRINELESRIGGWVISSPGFTVPPEAGAFSSKAIVVGATNSAGETNFPIYTRAKMLTGKYGVATATTTTTATAFVDAKSTETKIAENDYASITGVPTELEVASGVLQWNFTSPTSDLGPIYCEMAAFDLTTAKRAIPVCMIEGYQVRPETLADLSFTLGSEDGRRWSIEGPMDDDAATRTNAHVAIEWRWTSGSSLSSVSYVPFQSSEVYFRKCQFRLVFTRPASTYQSKVTRFTAKLYVPPEFDPADVDGGTF